MTADPSAARLFLFDIDGVFLAGKREPRLVSGTRILPALRERDLPFRLITNTSTHPRGYLVDGLARHGIHVAPDHIHSALEVTVAEAAHRFPGGRCHVVGEPGMAEVAGLSGALVLTGKTSRADIGASDVQPDLILDEVDDLVRLL